MPPRDSGSGFLLYYLNLVAFIAVSVFATENTTILAFAAVILCFLALVAQDAAWLRACYISPHDRALIEKITAMTAEKKTLELLRDYDLTKYAVSNDNLENLVTMRDEWIGVDFEFHNKHYQRCWQLLQDHIDNLLQIISKNSDYHNAYNFVIKGKQSGTKANAEARAILKFSEELRLIYIRKMAYA